MISSSVIGERLDLPDCDIWYYPQFLNTKVATECFNQLRQDTPWRQDDIRVFGKIYPQPRLTALYGNNQKPYQYSNIIMQPLQFTPLLKELKEDIDKISGTSFSTCLLNLYRDGQDSNGWHADDEKELGKNPVIASLSLGEERRFHLKHKKLQRPKTQDCFGTRKPFANERSNATQLVASNSENQKVNRRAYQPYLSGNPIKNRSYYKPIFYYPNMFT